MNAKFIIHIYRHHGVNCTSAVLQHVQKKSCHYIFASKFAKCRLIFRIPSPTDISVYFWQSNNKTSHHTSYPVLHAPELSEENLDEKLSHSKQCSLKIHQNTPFQKIIFFLGKRHSFPHPVLSTQLCWTWQHP